MLPHRGNEGPTAIECKWQAGSFDPSALLAFRRVYPRGRSFVVAADVERSYAQTHSGVQVDFVSLRELVGRLGGDDDRSQV